jgi:hypothetical protein
VGSISKSATGIGIDASPPGRTGRAAPTMTLVQPASNVAAATSAQPATIPDPRKHRQCVPTIAVIVSSPAQGDGQARAAALDSPSRMYLFTRY